MADDGVIAEFQVGHIFSLFFLRHMAIDECGGVLIK